jgi:hypothetical protein
MKLIANQSLFLKQQKSLTNVIKLAKDELIVMNSLNNMPMLVRKTNEPDMNIVEDEKFIATQEERNLELIQG